MEEEFAEILIGRAEKGGIDTGRAEIRLRVPGVTGLGVLVLKHLPASEV